MDSRKDVTLIIQDNLIQFVSAVPFSQVPAI